MSILIFILLLSAADYIYNREFTIIDRILGRRADGDGRRRGESKNPRIRRRVNRARTNREARREERQARRSYATANTVGGGHWAMKGNSPEARFEHDVLATWKRPDVAHMLRQTTNSKKKHRLAASLGRDYESMPAIYEWLCGLAWFYMSERPYEVIRSMNLTMDESWLPVSCAGAGYGDVVVRYPDCTVLIEASLMNLNNQRRNEWEPAMRHTAEVAAERDVPVYTLFVAPKLDQNTINVWRAVSKVPMRAKNGHEVRCRILPVTSAELAEWVEMGVPASAILDGIDRAYADDMQEDFDRGWREDFVSSL